MAGFIGLYRQTKKSFFWTLTFLIIFVYISSSWWMWYYASKCGQRIFIDILSVTGILLFFLYDWIRNKRILRIILTVLLSLLLALNLVQSYQHYRWIFPSTEIDGKMYWNAFFSLHPKARVDISEEAIVNMSSRFYDMESTQNCMNEGTISGLHSYSGKRSSLITVTNPYSAGLSIRLDSLFITNNRVIRISAMVFSLGPKKGALGVADFGDTNGSEYYKAFYLEPFAIPGKWTRIETAFYVPPDIGAAGNAKLYFYLPPGNDPFYIDDINIDFISLREEEIYTKIEGVLIPTK
jgi:hypothetical protein